MAVRLGWSATALAVAALLLAGATGAATRQATTNKANDKLMELSPPDRAATLARAVGHWCIGTEAFPMGVGSTGRAAGNAYWSLRCADSTTWAIQIDPMAAVTAIDCDTFKANGAGKECFKKF
jgi:hypothetical protein